MCLGDSPEIAAWYMDASADDFSPPFAGAGETGGTPDFFAYLGRNFVLHRRLDGHVELRFEARKGTEKHVG